MDILDIAPDKGTSAMLFAAGASDAQHGIDMHTGWREICEATGLANQRTPAREKYEDGWYSVPADKRKRV